MGYRRSSTRRGGSGTADDCSLCSGIEGGHGGLQWRWNSDSIRGFTSLPHIGAQCGCAGEAFQIEAVLGDFCAGGLYMRLP